MAAKKKISAARSLAMKRAWVTRRKKNKIAPSPKAASALHRPESIHDLVSGEYYTPETNKAPPASPAVVLEGPVTRELAESLREYAKALLPWALEQVLRKAPQTSLEDGQFGYVIEKADYEHLRNLLDAIYNKQGKSAS